jgi:hypothetical protein
VGGRAARNGSCCTFAARCSQLCVTSHAGVMCLLCLKFHCCICYTCSAVECKLHSFISQCLLPTAVDVDLTVINQRRAFALICDKEFFIFVAFCCCEVKCMINSSIVK